jgi:DNA-binding response OmpR family regulator
MSQTPDPRPRVLIVDDEELLGRSMARILARKGFDTVAETSPSAALERALKENFLAVVTDFAMPEFSGVELAGRLRTAGWKGLILLCTGNEAGVKQIAHVDGLIHKPVDFDALVDRLRQAVSGS